MHNYIGLKDVTCSLLDTFMLQSSFFSSFFHSPETMLPTFTAANVLNLLDRAREKQENSYNNFK